MPELPEVEVSRQGVAPKITGQTIARVIVRTPKLRWPIPKDVASVQDLPIDSVTPGQSIFLLIPERVALSSIWV